MRCSRRAITPARQGLPGTALIIGALLLLIGP
jgi:hypothetical protein